MSDQQWRPPGPGPGTQMPDGGPPAPPHSGPPVQPRSGPPPAGRDSPRRAVSDLISQLDRQPTVPVTGWRKLFGLGPSKAVQEKADDENWLRSSFPRPVTIAVATPKGGAGKTPTTVGLASAFGLARGGGVVAWDNNELNGSLGDRTFRSHNRTVADLLARQADLIRPEARVADVQALLNYQTNGQNFVLASSQEAGHLITEVDFTVTRDILSRFFPILVIDTGNNRGAPNWKESVHSADVVVVPVKWRKDNILKAGQMLETLTEQGRDVARRCVIVGTNGPGELMPEIRDSVADWFAPLPIVEIPTDLHLSEGAEIDWQRLQPATRRAYQSLGATAAQVISRYLRGDL